VPFTFGLPYPACLAATRITRKLNRRVARASHLDQEVYFKEQYHSTERLIKKFAGSIDVEDKVILDVGSGLGGRAPWFIEQGARAVYCIDVNRQELARGRTILDSLFPVSVTTSVMFIHPCEITDEHFGDVALLIDCFEHLTDASAVLHDVHRWLRMNGILWIGSIGWYHYLASHCDSHIPIPWSQVFFSEKAILKTIRTILREPGYKPNVWEQLEGIERWDNVQTLRERPGEPLNMLSLRQVRKIVLNSEFQKIRFKVHGFGGSRSKLLYWLRSLSQVPVLDEFLHSYYTVQALNQPKSSRIADTNARQVRTTEV
jgi:SAM-dependent methyltransferase